VFTFGDLVFFDCDGTRLYLQEVADDEWRPGSILYFLVPDIAVAYRTLTDRGIYFKGTPRLVFRNEDSGVEEWMSFFEDPDTNVLAIMSRVAPEPPSAAG
jgi:hypothetical protein